MRHKPKRIDSASHRILLARRAVQNARQDIGVSANDIKTTEQTHGEAHDALRLYRSNVEFVGNAR